MSKRFKPGQWIELREVWDGRTWELRRGIVVEDRADVVAIYTPSSTPALVAAGEDSTRLRLPPSDWSLVEAATSADRQFLAVHPSGAEHSVLAIWDNDWRFLWWYINLESDLVHTGTGFQYEDHVLDVIVEEDMKSWHWKDEDELGEALARGLFTREEAAAFYAEGEQARDWLMARRTPYDTLWENWRPSG